MGCNNTFVLLLIMPLIKKKAGKGLKMLAAKKSEDGRDEHCRECSAWFLGCLNGREKWSDKAIMPNHRQVRLEDESVSHVCDAFDLDPNPRRKGRAVIDESEMLAPAPDTDSQ